MMAEDDQSMINNLRHEISVLETNLMLTGILTSGDKKERTRSEKEKGRKGR